MRTWSEIDPNIDTLIRRAIDGDRQALELVVESIQLRIYNLALRMLQVPEDAEDAAQEILIKVVTHLSEFRGASAFTTWVYRIAANHLMNMRRRGAELSPISFDALSERLEVSLRLNALRPVEDGYEESNLSEEIKRSCTLGMLMCLDREQRLALILGELFELSGQEAAEILEISPEAYRKRLSRGRQALVTFVAGNCGIVNPRNPCRCNKHVRNAIEVGKLNPARLRYAQHTDAACHAQMLVSTREDIDALERTVGLLRAHPAYPLSEACISAFKRAIGVGLR